MSTRFELFINFLYLWKISINLHFFASFHSYIRLTQKKKHAPHQVNVIFTFRLLAHFFTIGLSNRSNFEFRKPTISTKKNFRKRINPRICVSQLVRFYLVDLRAQQAQKSEIELWTWTLINVLYSKCICLNWILKKALWWIIWSTLKKYIRIRGWKLRMQIVTNIFFQCSNHWCFHHLLKTIYMFGVSCRPLLLPFTLFPEWKRNLLNVWNIDSFSLSYKVNDNRYLPFSNTYTVSNVGF